MDKSGPLLSHHQEFRIPDAVECIRLFCDWETKESFGMVIELGLTVHCFDDRVR